MQVRIRPALRACVNRIISNYLVDFPLWMLKRACKLLTCGKLGMYLIGGIAICGGMGIILAWMTNGFDIMSKPVLNAILVFVPSIIATSILDLIYTVKSEVKHETVNISGLIVLSFVLLVLVGVAYFTEAANKEVTSNPKLTYWVWCMSLLYWTIANADDPKFSTSDNPNNAEGGEPMLRMSGEASIEGVKS